MHNETTQMILQRLINIEERLSYMKDVGDSSWYTITLTCFTLLLFMYAFKDAVKDVILDIKN